MRLRHRGGDLVHLAYCTNVHPAEDLHGILAQLDTYAVAVRDHLGADRLGIGLWLAHRVAAGLAADPDATLRLRAELTRRGLEVVTLNGFPYEGFHQPVVKHAVYRPDWSERARPEHTANLARVLALLLPDDVTTGSVSTLPFGWRTGWTGEHQDRARRHVDALGRELAELRHRTGRTIRIAFEPEPGCVVETTAQAVRHLQGMDQGHFGLCLDVCHLAVAFEDPRQALARLARAGIEVVKAQVSCALHAETPADPEVRRALGAFDEPRFLHQTRRAGTPAPGVDDLPEALGGAGDLSGAEAALSGAEALNRDAPWRSHFHIPVHADPAPPLTSTRPVLRETLAALLTPDRPRTTHLEVETYTWSVLPEPPRDEKELAAGIAAELDWTRRELLALGLTEPTTEASSPAPTPHPIRSSS
ncbi:xylose isomerase [Streptomyces sp. Root431]|uniref:metabolite traffic protein EboE n=1 Tax=Streptomyces sp. Root431 TaxID=1736535 RepID=UPI0006F535D9|nr:metabolite traffic protein EboE [Streptomyces sp. Root431]KQX14911.1 xylose isomerase [Streptomyces sp. Root431]